MISRPDSSEYAVYYGNYIGKVPDGSLLEKAGATRDGGSYDERMGNVACWNAVMDENDYMVRKWNEFIAS